MKVKLIFKSKHNFADKFVYREKALNHLKIYTVGILPMKMTENERLTSSAWVYLNRISQPHRRGEDTEMNL